jgi:hypothetical protein
MFMDAVVVLITEVYVVVLVAEHNAVTEPSLHLAVAKKENMYGYISKLFVVKTALAVLKGTENAL